MIGYVVDASPGRGKVRVVLDGFREFEVKTTFPVYVAADGQSDFSLYQHPDVVSVDEEEWRSFEGRVRLYRVELEELGALDFFRRNFRLYNTIPSPLTQALVRLNLLPFRLVDFHDGVVEVLNGPLDFPEITYAEVRRYGWFGPCACGDRYELYVNGELKERGRGSPKLNCDVAYCDGECAGLRASVKVRARDSWRTPLKALIERSLAAKVLLREIMGSSVGKALTVNEAWVAMERKFAVPSVKVNVERVKTLEELMRADRAGLMFFPRPGLYDDAYQLDFKSMYPSIILTRNISPEFLEGYGSPSARLARLRHEGLGLGLGSGSGFGFGVASGPSKPLPAGAAVFGHGPELGIVPEALKGLLEMRDALKGIDGERADAVKLMLVASFGYLGYRNSKFGRVEAYEEVTEVAREALMEAAALAERKGFRVIHGIVDSLTVQGPEGRLQGLLDDVRAATGLDIRVDSVFDWVAYTRGLSGEPHPQRYFGRLRGGGMKVRGLIKSNQPNLVKEFLLEVLGVMGNEVNGDDAKRAMIEALPSLTEKYVKKCEGGTPIDYVMMIRGVPYVRGVWGFYRAYEYEGHDPDYYAEYVRRASEEVRGWFD